MKVKLLITIVLTLTITSVTQPLQAFAMTRPLYYSRQGILMFDDECAANPDIGAVQLAGSDTLEKILNFFMQKGLNLAQASGIVGNMMQESGLNPAIIQGGGNAPDNYTPQDGVGFGLVQWTSFSARQQPLVKHIREELGINDIRQPEGQLSFVWKELNGPYQSTLSKLKATDDPIEAAVVVHDGYEVSADSDATVRSVRGGNAKKVYDKYKDAPSLGGETAKGEFKSPGGSPDGEKSQQKDPAQMVNTTKKQSACTNLPANEKELGKILQAYAWPDKRKDDIATPTDAYAEASARNNKNGIYIGGNSGIDCGGFVTQLMIDSGFEPNYNYSGKLKDGAGATATQQKWLQENWESLGSSPETLTTGDVAINSDHTFVYIRNKIQSDHGQYSWFHAETASASYMNPSRAPAADPDQDTALRNSGFQWYRKKGVPSSATQEKAKIEKANELRA